MGKNPADIEAWRKHVAKTMELASKLKRVMQKKSLRRARAVCPDCPDKFLNGTLNGRRDHMHFVCDCRKYSMME